MKNAALLATADNPCAAVRAYFGLTQAELACLLCVSQPQLAKAERGYRSLPPDANHRLRAIKKLLAQGPAPFPPADPAPLRVRLAACRLEAENMYYRLTQKLPLPGQAAANRLAARDTLPAALAAAEVDAVTPLSERDQEDQQVQLLQLRNAALAELEERSGLGPVTLLRARLAGLRAEAEVLARALGE